MRYSLAALEAEAMVSQLEMRRQHPVQNFQKRDCDSEWVEILGIAINLVCRD
jgi:hypothetical protein